MSEQQQIRPGVGTRWVAPNGQRVTVTATGGFTVHFEVDGWGADAPVMMPLRVFLPVFRPAPADDQDERPATDGPLIYGAEAIHMRWESPFYYADGRPMLAGDVVQVQTGSADQGTLVTSKAKIVGFSTTPIPDSSLAVSQVIVREESRRRVFRVAPPRTAFISR